MSENKIQDRIIEEFYPDEDALNQYALIDHPNLQKLVIIGQKLVDLSCILFPKGLVQLFLIETTVKSLPHSSFEFCSELKNLYLYESHLPDLDTISKLTSLRCLWIAGNKINSIQILESLVNLEELNVSNNNLAEFEPVLWTLSKLKFLYFAGNRIDSLGNVYELLKKSKITHLWLKHPLYKPCPVTSLCNYRELVLYHNTYLKQLDGVTITWNDKETLEVRIEGYRQLYRMHGYNLSVDQVSKLKVIKAARENLRSCLRDHLFRALDTQYTLAMATHGMTLSDKSTEIGPDVVVHSQLSVIEKKVAQVCTELSQYDERHHNAESQLESYYQFWQDLWDLELSSARNVTFECVDNTSDTFNQVSTFLRSTFCSRHYGNHGIRDVHLRNCLKINRKTSEPERAVNGESRPLFYLVSPGGEVDFNWIIDYLSQGILIQKGDVILTNSLWIADNWVPCSFQGRETSQNKLLETESQKNRIVLLTSLVWNDSQFSFKTSKPRVREDGVWHQSCCCQGVDVSVTDIHLQCTSCSNARDVKCNSSARILPQYILEFTYLKESYLNEKLDAYSGPLTQFLQEWTLDQIKQPKVPKLTVLTPELLECFRNFDKTPEMCVLNLSGHNIRKLITLDDMENIKEINLSCNKLLCFPNIQPLISLETLNVSYNNIKNCGDLRVNSRLKNLDLRFNLLNHKCRTIVTLAANLPAIVTIHLLGNPWLHCNKLPFRSLESMMNLMYVDDRPVTRRQQSVTILNTYPTCCRITGLGDSPRDLCDPKEMASRAEWQKIVNLAGNSLCELPSGLSMKYAEWLCLSRNCLTDVTLQCKYLRVLNLSDNHLIEVPPALLTLQNLEVLNLTNNNIKSIDCDLGEMVHLKALFLTFNLLAELPPCFPPSIQELFVEYNQLAGYENIKRISNSEHLVSLSLKGNPMWLLPDVTELIIFSNPNIKILNGQFIDLCAFKDSMEKVATTFGVSSIRIMSTPCNLEHIITLKMNECGLSSIADNLEDVLSNLTVLDLSDNKLTSVEHLQCLESLKVLVVDKNEISESILPPQQDTRCRYFNKLEVLHAEHNRITSLESFGTHNFPYLKCLFLSYNQIQSLEDMKYLSELQLLVMDYNRVKTFSFNSISHLRRLQRISIENNRISSIDNIPAGLHITTLYLGYNQIRVMEEFLKLKALNHLTDLNILCNPCSGEQSGRRKLLTNLPTLKQLNMVNIQEEERLQLQNEEVYNTFQEISTNKSHTVVHLKMFEFKPEHMFGHS